MNGYYVKPDIQVDAMACQMVDGRWCNTDERINPSEKWMHIGSDAGYIRRWKDISIWFIEMWWLNIMLNIILFKRVVNNYLPFMNIMVFYAGWNGCIIPGKLLENIQNCGHNKTTYTFMKYLQYIHNIYIRVSQWISRLQRNVAHISTIFW